MNEWRCSQSSQWMTPSRMRAPSVSTVTHHIHVTPLLQHVPSARVLLLTSGGAEPLRRRQVAGSRVTHLPGPRRLLPRLGDLEPNGSRWSPGSWQGRLANWSPMANAHLLKDPQSVEWIRGQKKSRSSWLSYALSQHTLKLMRYSPSRRAAVDSILCTSANKTSSTLIGSRKTRTDTGFAGAPLNGDVFISASNFWKRVYNII